MVLVAVSRVKGERTVLVGGVPGWVVQPVAGRGVGPQHQGVRVAEVGRRRGQRTERGKDVQPRPAGVRPHLLDQLPVQQQAQCGQRRAQRADRWWSRARVPRGQQVDVVHPLGVGVGQRARVPDGAVDERALTPSHRGQEPGHGRAGCDRRHHRATAQEQGGAGDEVGCGHVQPEPRLLERVIAQVVPQEQPQRGGGEEGRRPADGGAEPASRVGDEHVATAHPRPQVGERGQPMPGCSRPGDVRGVHSTDGRADQQVRVDALLVQGRHHPDLDGAETAAAGQDERGAPGAHRPGLAQRPRGGPGLVGRVVAMGSS